MNYPFLFLGAGQVQNSDWTHIYIKFKKCLEEDQIELISRHSPDQLEIYRENFEGCMMFAMTVPVNEELNNSLKIYDGDKSDDSKRQYEKDLEEWLLMIHSHQESVRCCWQ